jgi:quinol monooxygenase YgiN
MFDNRSGEADRHSVVQDINGDAVTGTVFFLVIEEKEEGLTGDGGGDPLSSLAQNTRPLIARATKADSGGGISKLTFISSVRWTEIDSLADRVRACRQHAAATTAIRVDLPFGGGLAQVPWIERFLTISTHEVKQDRVDEYLELRRIAVHPEMARLRGFISSDVLRKTRYPNQFLIVNQWMDNAFADAYSSSPIHDSLRVQVRARLLSHSGMREFDLLSRQRTDSADSRVTD